MNRRFIILFVIALVLRLFVAFQPFEEDEYHWAGSAEREDWFGSVMRNSPLSIYAAQVSVNLLGLSVLAIRLPFIIAGLLTIFGVYFFARKLAGEKTALVAAALLALSPHHILASTQATYEGSFLALFFFLTLAAVIEKQYFWSGMFFGFALLSKTSAFVLFPPLVFLLSWRDAKLFTAVKITFLNLLAGLSIFFVGFGIPSIIAQSPAFINSIAQLISQTGFQRENFLLLLIQYAQAIIWIGPLLLFAPLFSSWNKNKKYWFVIGYILLFYIIIVKDNFPPIERYLMILLPFLSILSADSIASLKLTKKNVVMAGIVFCAAVAGGVALQLMNNDVLPFSQKTTFIERVINFSLNFLVPISGSSGPVGFYLPFSIIGIAFIISAGIFISSFFDSKKMKAVCLTVMFGVGGAYSFLFYLEYATGIFNGSVPDAIYAVIDYANAHDLQAPVYFMRNYALQYTLDARYKRNPVLDTLPKFDYFSFDSYRKYDATVQLKLATQLGVDKNIRTLSFADDNELKVQELKKEGGTFLIVDFPAIDKSGPLFGYLRSCNKTRVHEIGYVFVC
ncbi:MAG: glycosyltransferase family 39 protein [Candidatus Aenigmarchaeota archaeon]|nr:glycosyltransferase family 39 protein [Candidatus Aenigmarchaeota archaeon]